MKRTRVASTLVFGLIAVMGAALFAADKAEHPSALFKQYCAKCHGEDGKANTPKGSQLMARDFTDAEFQASKTDAQLIETVTKGHEDMPPFGKKLTAEQIESLVKNDVRGFKKK
jgi:mono/diheme cytochrome c family protein